MEALCGCSLCFYYTIFLSLFCISLRLYITWFGLASSFSPLLPSPLPSPISYTLSADPCASFYLITLMAVWYPLSPFPPLLAISPFLREHWLLYVQPSLDHSLETDESICSSQSNKNCRYNSILCCSQICHDVEILFV